MANLNFGSAAAYAILAAAGITNTGNTSVIGGVVGSFPTTSITGFPASVVIDNADAQVALQDALRLYNALSILPYTSLSATTANLSLLGNGSSASTYVPGNYSAGTSMSM